jgi:levanase/levanbiose-producing levanase
MREGSFDLHDASFRLPDAAPGSAYVIEAEILPRGAEQLSFHLLGNGSTWTVLSYNPATGRLVLDRRRSGDTGFHEKFATAESAPLVLEDGALKLQIVVDHCSVEVFAQDGKVVLTDLVFPDHGSVQNRLTVAGGRATVRALTVTALS